MPTRPRKQKRLKLYRNERVAHRRGKMEENVRRVALRNLALATATAFGVMFSGAAMAQEKLTVWWVKGFYPAEDAALFEAIKKYEAKSGVKVDLSQYAVQDMIPKTVAALDAGTPPDLAYADVFDFQVAA